MIPDFIEAGIDVLNPVQINAANMDPVRLKREFGRDLAFWGAVDTQHLLPQASPDEVKARVRELVEVLGSDGGYVVSAANNIQADTPARYPSNRFKRRPGKERQAALTPVYLIRGYTNTSIQAP